MSIINEIRPQVRIQAGHKLHDSECVSLEVWGEAYVIQEDAIHLLIMNRIIADQIDEDLDLV
jgi:hypothetical protein